MARWFFHARSQDQLARAISTSGGSVATRPTVTSTFLQWCAQTETSGDIVAVDFRTPEATERFVRVLDRMPNMQDCTVVGPTIDDRSLILLFRSRKMRSIILDSTSVSDSGRSHLSAIHPFASVNVAHRWSNQLIYRLRVSIDESYDPVDAVRAVNHLRRVGKVNAIAALKDYVGQHSVEDHQVLCLLVPILFEPTDPSELLPAPIPLRSTDEYSQMITEISLGQKSQEDLAVLEDKYATRFSLELMRWPDDFGNLIVCDGVPFHVVLHSGVLGYKKAMVRRDYLVAWAAEKGKLRETLLVPTDAPEDSLRKLFSRFGDSFASPIERRRWREQCIDQLHLLLGGLATKAQISEAVSAGHTLNVSWDKQSGAYMRPSASGVRE